MIANTRLYFFILIGTLPLVLIGLWQLLGTSNQASITSIESLIVSLLIIYDFMLIIMLIIDNVLSIDPNEITITRSVEEKLSINRLNSVKLNISNFSTQPLVAIIKDDYPEIPAYYNNDKTKELPLNRIVKINLPPGSKGEFVYNLKPDYRGDYFFENTNLRYLSRFKFFWKQVRYPNAKKIKVYPDLIGLQELSFKLTKSSNVGETKIRKFGQGTEFSSLREYVIGDDVRKIDWRATARRDFPVVKTFQLSKDQTILILLDAGRMMATKLSGLSRFDWGVNATLSLALAALNRGDQVGIGVFADSTKLYIPPNRGKVSLKNIIEGIHSIQPEPVEPDYVGVLAHFASIQKKRALIVVITDLIDPIASKSLLTGLAHLTPRHLPFCVTFNDKGILKLANSQVNKIEDVYLQSVSIDLLEQRKQALNVLVRKGGMFLDVPPEDLSNAIVEKYLTIKSKVLI